MRIFEFSFEVCNKVGGIYTVVSSKAALTTHEFEDYWCVGPMIGNGPSQREFTPSDVPDKFIEPFEKLSQLGIKAHTGVWNIAGQPKVILLDIAQLWHRKDDLKRQLWDAYQVDSLYAGYDFEEPLLVSYAAAQLASVCNADVLQTHEWMCGMAALFSKMIGARAHTVFTTHATVVGRAACSRGDDIKQLTDQHHPNEVARMYDVLAKHTAERASAQNADVFTTVSDITADEAKVLLGRQPDILTYNGLDRMQYPWVEFRDSFRNQLLDSITWVLGYALKDPIIMMVSGRNEFRNKGVDLTLRALAQINGKPGRQVVCCICMPMQHNGPKIDPSHEPYFSTHYLEQTPAGEMLRELGLYNTQQDRVKVVIIPVYLDGTDTLMSMQYDDVVRGCDIGLFPSWYEPWGYTPLECAALGVPAVTSDVTGFGQYIQEYDRQGGVYIIERWKNPLPVENFAKLLEWFCSLDANQMLEQRRKAYDMAHLADWHHLIYRYFYAWSKVT